MGQDAKLLVGSWNMISALAQDAGGKVLGHLFGTAPHGLLHYGADGVMMVMIFAGGEGAGFSPDGEPVPSSYHYVGHHEVRGQRVLHHILESNDERIKGRTLRRRWAMIGEELELSWTLKPGQRGLIRWQRMPKDDMVR